MNTGNGVRVCAAIIALFTLINTASASLIAYDNASEVAYNDGWQPGDNGGAGWGGGWTFRNGANAVRTLADFTTDASFYGRFVADSRNNNSPAGAGGDSNSDGDINTLGNKAWGMYANTANELYAVRPFSGALNVGQTVRFTFDNGNVDSTRVLGVRLLANASDINTRQIELRFVGGDPVYTVFSGGTPPTTTHGFSREGILGEFTLTGTTTYSLRITRLQSGVVQTVTGTLVSPGGNNAINAIAFRNLAAGSGAAFDGFFNSIAIPEPGSLSLLTLLGFAALRRGRRSA